jgi:ATP-dependent DNA ligase
LKKFFLLSMSVAILALAAPAIGQYPPPGLSNPTPAPRTINWTKVTCRNRETFYAVGIANKGKKFDGIYLARRDGHELLYAGKVERGFTMASEKSEKAARAVQDETSAADAQG